MKLFPAYEVAVRRFLPFASAVVFLTLVAPVSMVAAQEVVSLTQEQQEELASEIQQAVQQIKPTLPRQLDEVTTLIDVANEGITMIYSHTLTLNLTPVIQEKLTAHLRKTVCGNAELRQTLIWGVTFRYRYQDKDGNPAAAIDVTNQDCTAA